MQEPLNTPTSVVFVTTILLSVAALYYLWQKHAGGQRLLAYEPRKGVPWNLLAAFLAICLPSVLVLFVLDNDVADLKDLQPADFIYLGWIQSLVKLGVVVIGLACLATFSRASSQDLGFPESVSQLIKDSGLGVFACLAAMLPIYMVQFALTTIFQSDQQHELIDQMQSSYSLQMVFVSLGMAVLVAPIYEEFAFRLLFQGWLEKLEDRLVESNVLESETAHTSEEESEWIRPQRGMFPEIPHGWAPILISGLVFGLVHLGQNFAAPVSLTLFGIVLGYLYQRTHRLLPCIVAHMTFNGFTMLLLLLQLGRPPV